MAIVDLSIQVQQSSLLYHLGLRESFGMKQNILLYNDLDTEVTLRVKVCMMIDNKSNINIICTNEIIFQLSCGSYIFLSYKLADCGTCLTTNTSFQEESGTCAFEPRVPITVKLKKLLKDVEVQTKYEHITYTFFLF